MISCRHTKGASMQTESLDLMGVALDFPATWFRRLLKFRNCNSIGKLSSRASVGIPDAQDLGNLKPLGLVNGTTGLLKEMDRSGVVLRLFAALDGAACSLHHQHLASDGLPFRSKPANTYSLNLELPGIHRCRKNTFLGERPGPHHGTTALL